jgi:hypothetical protein
MVPEVDEVECTSRLETLPGRGREADDAKGVAGSVRHRPGYGTGGGL